MRPSSTLREYSRRMSDSARAKFAEMLERQQWEEKHGFKLEKEKRGGDNAPNSWEPERMRDSDRDSDRRGHDPKRKWDHADHDRDDRHPRRRRSRDHRHRSRRDESSASGRPKRKNSHKKLSDSDSDSDSGSVSGGRRKRTRSKKRHRRAHSSSEDEEDRKGDKRRKGKRAGRSGTKKHESASGESASESD